MAQAIEFGNLFLQTCQNLVNDLTQAQELIARLTANPNLFGLYLNSTGARTDIAVADMQNAQSALSQLIFTFTSGSPTQSSYLFNML
jgi:hypothetical protein